MEGEGGARWRAELCWRRLSYAGGRSCAGGGEAGPREDVEDGAVGVALAEGGATLTAGGAALAAAEMSHESQQPAAAEMGSGLEALPLHARFLPLFSPKFHFSRSGIPARSGRFSLIFFASARGSAAFQFLARLIAAYRVMVCSGRNRSGEAPMRLILRFPQCNRPLF